MKFLKNSLLAIFITILFSTSFFVSCNGTTNDATENSTEQTPEDSSDSSSTTETTTNSSTTKTITYVTKIDGSALSDGSYAFATIALSDYEGKTVSVDFSTSMYVENNSDDSATLMWQINTGNSTFPTIASQSFDAGTTDWTTVSGTKTGDDAITLGSGAAFYLSTYNLTASNFVIYLNDFSLKITVQSDSEDEESTEVSFTDSDFYKSDAISSEDLTTIGTWLSSSVPSLYETYKDYFDYIGIAAEYGNFGLSQTGSNKYTATYKANEYWGKPSELYYEEIQNGIKKHANSITLGNEMKPQFLLAWWNTGDGAKQTMTNFTASNGQTIKVPSSLNNENLIYATLNVAKAMGVQMRGHVFTWHSQTPDDFFAEEYSAKSNDSFATLSNPVSKEVMTARQEWYIKKVLECVANWESANGYGIGNHIIWAWDVVNEATADDAGNTYSGDSQNWLRGSTSSTKNVAPANGGSRWYQIYGDEEFIVNAFRFANAYAPSDVKLCYNDYNEYWNAEGHYKTNAICNLIDCVKNGSAETINGNSVSPRIDVMAMQSHVGTSWPGVDGYETALKKFLAKEVDVHVSELDFSATTQEDAVTAYADYFKMLSKYGKKSSDTYKIENVTIWGINNENSWINPSNGVETYPLLFNLIDNVSNNSTYDVGDSYAPNDSFWAVINALSSN